MNKVILSSVVSDLLGQLVFEFAPGKSQLTSRSRRVSRRATLDGGSVVEDYGFSHTDRTLVLSTTLGQAKMEILNHLVETSTSIMVSTSDGMFLGVFQDSKVKGREAVLKILIKEKLA